MGLCPGCRALADELAAFETNAASFQLFVGEYAKRYGHAHTHDELNRLHGKRFGIPTLDDYLLRKSVALTV